MTSSTTTVCHICNGSGRIGGGRRPEYTCPACTGHGDAEPLLDEGVLSEGEVIGNMSLNLGESTPTDDAERENDMSRSPGHTPGNLTEPVSRVEMEQEQNARPSLETSAGLEASGLVPALKVAVRNANDHDPEIQGPLPSNSKKARKSRMASCLEARGGKH